MEYYPDYHRNHIILIMIFVDKSPFIITEEQNYTLHNYFQNTFHELPLCQDIRKPRGQDIIIIIGSSVLIKSLINM